MGAVHAGEREVQARLGVHERSAAAMQQVVRLAMPAQHIELFEKLPTMLVGGLDASHRPWATMLAGAPGFVRAPDDRHLRIAARPAPDDPLQLQAGQRLGLLGLEPHTRRRNRMNGRIVAIDAQSFCVEVEQSFGNCPRYIQARVPQMAERTPSPPAAAEGPRLSELAQRLVAAADTLFIASSTPPAGEPAEGDGVDVSHRGGLPGFVQVDETPAGASLLRIPDYPGNNFFNTWGNLAANPRAGLLFIDHEGGGLLQLTGRTALDWGEGEQGLRQICFHVDAGWWRAGVLPLRWAPPEFAPQFQR